MSTKWRRAPQLEGLEARNLLSTIQGLHPGTVAVERLRPAPAPRLTGTINGSYQIDAGNPNHVILTGLNGSVSPLGTVQGTGNLLGLTGRPGSRLQLQLQLATPDLANPQSTFGLGGSARRPQSAVTRLQVNLQVNNASATFPTNLAAQRGTGTAYLFPGSVTTGTFVLIFSLRAPQR